MKSIPSLVASSTIGVAATGLVFGRPQFSTPGRPSSNKRKATEYDRGNQVPSGRPAMSSTMSTPNREEGQSSSPYTSYISSPEAMSNGHSPNEILATRVGQTKSTTRKLEIAAAREHDLEGRKDSISSRGSWIKRLSAVPTSQNASPRSSVGPDSPSLTFSHGSAAPMLNTNGNSAQLLPNKLVKRTTSRRGNGDGLSRSGSKSQVPTLRRPATSHQRSATLQQQFMHSGQESMDTTAHNPSSSPAVDAVVHIPNQSSSFSSRNQRWKPYFESRVTKITKERSSSGWIEGNSPEPSYSTSRRVLLPDVSFPAPTLIKPAMVIDTKSKASPNWKDAFPATDSEFDSLVSSNKSSPSNENDSESHKRLRRSLSINFSSPTRWISRTGSLRGPRRGGNGVNLRRRNVSAPLPTVPGRVTRSSHGPSVAKRRDITDPTIYQKRPTEYHEGPLSQNPFNAPTSTIRSRNSSSPLPPLSRLSSFSLDLGRMSVSSSPPNGQRDALTSPVLAESNATSPSLVSPRERRAGKHSTSVVIHQYRSPRPFEMTGSDRASTLVGSDYENRVFTSGDEDDMDFQSDTVFDSFRTGATGSLRSRNPPLEKMFDESPPSAGSKPRSPTPLEINSPPIFRDANERIIEEDEGMVTPIKDRRILDDDKFSTPTRATFTASADDAIRSSPPSFSLATRDFARLSIEDDEEEEEEDWTKDDDSILMTNSLSPASRPSSSVNSRRVSPTTRHALTTVMKGSSSTGSGLFEERPRSVFDWSEPLSSEKTDLMGNSPRPKTVHGKQTGDGRGGRSVGRKGPSALHIRSQSVPVVPDVTGHREHTKLTPKFGTWGLGAKGVSEDWDNDFEFMEVDESDSGQDGMSSSAMLIPPAIQASQASVVGHVGQIREICLLVEDLKRLRGQAREKGILNGPSANLWRDAEGIVALAIPDDEDQTLSPPKSPDFDLFNPDMITERYRNGSFDNDGSGGDEKLCETETEPELRSTSERRGTSRRQSVFSPEDDIFGAGRVPTSEHVEEENELLKHGSRRSNTKDSSNEARSVMKNIHQHRVTSDPLHGAEFQDKSSAMPFDTTSLRDLVQRANHLRTTLAEIIRKADGDISPHRSPIPERDSSPAFTRVFTDPLATPPKRLTRTQSKASTLNNSIDASPTRGLGQRMPMMTVV